MNKFDENNAFKMYVYQQDFVLYTDTVCIVNNSQGKKLSLACVLLYFYWEDLGAYEFNYYHCGPNLFYLNNIELHL